MFYNPKHDNITKYNYFFTMSITKILHLNLNHFNKNQINLIQEPIDTLLLDQFLDRDQVTIQATLSNHAGETKLINFVATYQPDPIGRIIKDVIEYSKSKNIHYRQGD